ncbi:Phosphotransferase enzyme family [Streptococcus pneumoniae]|nr:Phosphotransferase enzyme family [Streptococcus pneumoniae]
MQDVGRVLAAIHTLPSDVVDHADLPSYTAEQIRQRHLHALDQAATSGRVPPLLLRRWEEAMEEEALWRFTPVPVHGDLHEDNLLLERGRVVGVTGWTDLHVGDPAGDVAWLAAATDPDLADRVLDAYAARRADAGAADDGDAHLMRRAALLAEFALAQWLTRGLDRHDAGMVAEAEAMLAELEGDVRAAQEAAARQAEADAAADAAEDARDAAEDAREAAAARTADPETGPLPAVEVVRPINGGPGRP